MKLSTLLLFALPWLAANPVRRAPVGELVYAARAGTKVVHTYTNPGERTLQSMRLSFGGDEHPTGEMEITETIERTVVFEDEIVEAEGDRATKLRRTFVELSRSTTEKVSMKDQADSEEAHEQKSGLADATVVFVWDADEDRYDAGFDGKGGDESLLESLEADVELRGFLPDKEVSKGDRWKVELAAFRAMLEPGGDLGFEGDPPEPAWQKKVTRDVKESLQGEIHARYDGTREVDGVEVGVIALTAEISGEAEVDPDPDRRGSQGGELTIKEQFEGELLWDLAAKRARSYELKGAGRMSLNLRLAFEMNGEKLEGAQELAFDVRETYAGTFEVRR